MKKVDMTNVQEAGEGRRIPAGKYIIIIRKAEDVSDKEYLKITYDIADGEYKGYYDDMRKRFPDSQWIGAYVKSYKQKALPMFKRFCSAVSKSNGGFIFDGNTVNADETTLIGKKLGIVLAEEEYYSNSGELRTRLFVHSECPIDRLESMRVPECKRLKDDKTMAKPADDSFMTIEEGAADEVPF